MPLLAPILVFFEATKYPLIFIGCYIEGTVVMLATGMLWHTGAVSFWPAYFSLLAADFLSDMMWYFVGLYGARTFVERWGEYVGLTAQNLAKVERRFHEYHTWILLISKLSMGFGLAVATLTTAGMLRIPLYRYALINGLGGIVWVFGVMIVGYYFGNVLEYVPANLQLIFVALILGLSFFGLKLLNNKLAQSDW